MSRRKIFEARHRLLWKGRGRHHSFKPYKRCKRQRQSLHHRMSRFSHRHDAYLPEFLQVQRLFAAHDSRALPPQLPLHRRRDIYCGQGLVEDLAGELFQFRHGRLAPSFGYPFSASGFKMFAGRRPCRSATTFSAAMHAILVRVSSEADAMCGASTTFARRKPG